MVKSNIYLLRLSNILDVLRPRLTSTHGLEYKNCFGAVAGYVKGRIFISCGRFGVALRLPPKTLNVLFKGKEVKALRYFKKGHIKKEYAVLSGEILGNRTRMKKLIDLSIRYSSPAAKTGTRRA